MPCALCVRIFTFCLKTFYAIINTLFPTHSESAEHRAQRERERESETETCLWRNDSYGLHKCNALLLLLLLLFHWSVWKQRQRDGHATTQHRRLTISNSCTNWKQKVYISRVRQTAHVASIQQAHALRSACALCAHSRTKIVIVQIYSIDLVPIPERKNEKQNSRINLMAIIVCNRRRSSEHLLLSVSLWPRNRSERK